MTEDGERRQVSRERAHEIIDEAAAGTLIAIDVDAVPTLGEVPEDEREIKAQVRGYRFGELDEFDL